MHPDFTVLPELTAVLAPKVARVWVWCAGHQPARCKDRVSRIDDRGDVCVGDPERDMWFERGSLAPDLSDPATVGGMSHSARAAWRDEHAYAMWSQAGKWKVFVHHFGLVTVYEGRTEADAWLAAILAAPEEK